MDLARQRVERLVQSGKLTVEGSKGILAAIIYLEKTSKSQGWLTRFLWSFRRPRPWMILRARLLAGHIEPTQCIARDKVGKLWALGLIWAWGFIGLFIADAPRRGAYIPSFGRLSLIIVLSFAMAAIFAFLIYLYDHNRLMESLDLMRWAGLHSANGSKDHGLGYLFLSLAWIAIIFVLEACFCLWWKWYDVKYNTVWSRDDCQYVYASLEGDILVIGSGGKLLRLDPMSGANIWAVSRKGGADRIVRAGEYLITSGEGEIIAYHLSDGSIAWRNIIGSREYEVQTQDDCVAVGTDTAIEVYSSDTGTLRWKYFEYMNRGLIPWNGNLGILTKAGIFIALDTRSGKEIWRLNDVSCVYGACCGYIQIFRGRGNGRLIDANTGQEVKGVMPKEEVSLEGGISGRLYFLNGKCSIICVDPEIGEEIWRGRLPWFRGMGEWDYMPLIAGVPLGSEDKRLYFRGSVQLRPSVLGERAWRLDALSRDGKVIWIAHLPGCPIWIRSPYLLYISGTHNRRQINMVRINI